MVQYFLHSLGEPPYPRKLMKKVPMKRWWCGSLCGGVNDMLPGLGLMWSREPHQLTLTDSWTAEARVSDLRFAFRVVVFFIWSYVILNVMSMAVSSVPTQVEKDDKGWCHYPKPLSDVTSVVVTVAAISSTFVGSAGLSIISNAVSYALGEADTDSPKELYNVKRKAAVGSIYLQLPLLKVLLPMLPLQYLDPLILVPKTDHSVVVASGGWQSTGNYVKCPVYDNDVMIHMVYGVMVILLMAYTSYHNMILYLPSRDRDVARELREELEVSLVLLQYENSWSFWFHNVSELACERAALWQLSLALLQEMGSDGIAPDEISFNTVLGSLDKGQGPWTLALAVLQERSHHGFPVDLPALGVVVACCERSRKTSAAADDDFDHTSVLLDEVVEAFTSLRLPKSPVLVDCTLGGAGHSQAGCIAAVRVGSATLLGGWMGACR
eukprot:s172_g12.t1